jgi:HK97 family phage prohead protease
MVRQVNRLWVDCPFEIKAIDNDGRIEGHGAVFGSIDLGFDRIEPGAFTETIKDKGDVPMLWQHFSDKPIGVWDGLKEDRHGLLVSGQINLDTQQGREARSLVKQGAVRGLSIGYRAKDFEFEEEVRVLKRVELFEVSLATFPMNPEARVAGVKNHTPKVLEQSLRDIYGLSRRASKQVAAFIRNFEHEDGDDDSDVIDDSVAGMLRAFNRKLRNG